MVKDSLTPDSMLKMYLGADLLGTDARLLGYPWGRHSPR